MDDVAEQPVAEPHFAEQRAVELTSLSVDDQAFLRRTVRFLVNVLTPGFAAAARREGYSSKEHALGWQLWRTAAGETRPFDHWMREQQVAGGTQTDGDEQLRLLQEIDAFENTWFPRTRAIIRRVVAKDRRDAFAAAFFKDLAQQPLGPAVVGSVSTYVTRLEGLQASSEAEAKAVRAMLRSRGLTDGRITDIKRLLERARDGVEACTDDPAVTAEELAQARHAQLEALDGLRDWFNDWGTTLRPRFGTRDQIRLGLTIRKRRTPPGEDVDVGSPDDEDDDVEGPDDLVAA